jgi:hypothetical protein
MTWPSILAHFPVSLAAMLGCLGVSLYAFRRSKGRPERFSLARVLFIAGIWTSYSFSTSWTTNAAMNTYVARVLYAVAAFVPDAFCRLVLTLIPTPRRTFQWFTKVVRGGSLLFVFLAFHPNFILGVQDVGGIHAVLPGPLYGFYVVYLLIGMGWGFVELTAHHKSLEGIDRNKLKYFFLGFILAYLGAGLHFVGAYTRQEPFPHDLLILFFAVFVFLGLWNPSRDFNELLRRWMAQGVFGAALGLPLGILVWFVGAGRWTAVLTFVGVTLAPTVFLKWREGIFSLVDRLPTFRGKFVRPDILAHEVTVVTEARSLEEWARRVVHAVRDVFGARSASLLLRQEDMASFLIKAGIGLTPGELGLLSIPFNSPVVARLNSSRQCILSECLEALSPHDSKDELEDLRFIHACAIAPIFCDGKLFALICLGPKANGEIYNQSDVVALLNIMHSAQNALVAVLAGQSRQQQSSYWAHDLIRPFGPKGSMNNVERALRGDYGPLPEKASKALDLAAQDTKFVAQKIKYLLDPTGEDRPEVQPTSFTSIYARTQDRFAPQVREKRIEWKVDIPSESLKILADAPLIEHRVMANLVENALRHTPQGGTVEVGYQLDGNRFLGYVRDTGPGIKKEDLPHLFTPGIQLDPNNKGLAGLGLASVKSVIEAHNGQVWAESEWGKGTTFFFSVKIIED